MIKKASIACGLGDHIGTHSLRKSHAYHLYVTSGRRVDVVQDALDHRTSEQTLKYIGVTRKEVSRVMKRLRF